MRGSPVPLGSLWLTLFALFPNGALLRVDQLVLPLPLWSGIHFLWLGLPSIQDLLVQFIKHLLAFVLDISELFSGVRRLRHGHRRIKLQLRASSS